MNLFLEYKKKIFVSLKKLEKKKLIKIPKNFKSFTLELPPKDQKADISCNIAMVLAKFNKINPFDMANLLKKNLLLDIFEFESIDVAKPGFLNITFN